MAVRTEVDTSSFERLIGQTQPALLAQLQENAQIIEAAIKEEAPVDEGTLRDNIRIGSIRTFGPHRFQIAVEIDLDKVPYYYAIIRGVQEQVVGQPGKKYSPHIGRVWVGPWTMPARSPNNFPKRAIRRVGPQIIGLTARNFITRVQQ